MSSSEKSDRNKMRMRFVFVSNKIHAIFAKLHVNLPMNIMNLIV